MDDIEFIGNRTKNLTRARADLSNTKTFKIDLWGGMVNAFNSAPWDDVVFAVGIYGGQGEKWMT